MPPERAISAGLSSAEAERLLREVGPNEAPEPRRHPLWVALGKLIGPIPFMLEGALGLELWLGKRIEAGILVALLLRNASISLSHERRARGALELLKKRLAVLARVRRDGAWTRLPAEALVPGDLVHLRIGDFVPADVKLEQGELLLDRSMLTGESAAAETGAGALCPAGSIVRRGEATGQVVATGARTSLGKTVSLVGQARGRSHLETLVVSIAGWFVAFDAALALVVVVVAAGKSEHAAAVVEFALMLLLASVPVALPAMFTLATAVGSLELAHRSVLTTRLRALEEIAALDVLCCDKTGTLTENKLSVAEVRPAEGSAPSEVLALAAKASDPATQDPIDLAILAAARGAEADDEDERIDLVPFDPATKRAEAKIRRAGRIWRVVKGAPAQIARLAPPGSRFDADVKALAERAYRVLAVAAGPDDHLAMTGLVALHDPPRADSRAVAADLREHGVRVVMVTGDGAATAEAVAAEIGLGSRVTTRPDADPDSFDALAQVLPEDKLTLVRALRRAGHVVGMTGDGVNDAPALEHADVGIAVASAVDVAKSAASVVLTEPGLRGVLDAIEVGRRVYQRMLSYTLNTAVKKLQVPVFLAAGYLALGRYVLTPRLLLLMMIANDLATMTLASDRARPSPRPERWHARRLVAIACAISAPWIAFLLAAFEIGRRSGLSLPAGQTLSFLALVYMAQANVYMVRERGPLWRSLPGRWTIAASALAVVAVTLLACTGALMEPLAPAIALGLFGAVAAFTLALDLVKAKLYARFRK